MTSSPEPASSPEPVGPPGELSTRSDGQGPSPPPLVHDLGSKGASGWEDEVGALRVASDRDVGREAAVLDAVLEEAPEGPAEDEALEGLEAGGASEGRAVPPRAAPMLAGTAIEKSEPVTTVTSAP